MFQGDRHQVEVKGKTRKDFHSCWPGNLWTGTSAPKVFIEWYNAIFFFRWDKFSGINLVVRWQSTQTKKVPRLFNQHSCMHNRLKSFKLTRNLIGYPPKNHADWASTYEGYCEVITFIRWSASSRPGDEKKVEGGTRGQIPPHDSLQLPWDPSRSSCFLTALT